MQAEAKDISHNDHTDWVSFTQHESLDPYDDFGWFHVTVGLIGDDAGNNFQVCVSTPRAVGRAKRVGDVPGILVDRFDAESVRIAIHDRIASISGHTWDQIVDQCRAFMRWEYEGMAGS